MNLNLWSPIISACIAAFVTIYIARKNIFSPIKLEVAKKQLYCVYLPLFKFLEPNLYKKADIQVINEFLSLFKDIKNNYYELIDSNLMNDIDILNNSISSDSYNLEVYDSICRLVDKHFERKRKLLHLPRRTLLYKINKQQFNISTKDLVNFLLESMIELIPYILMLLIMTFIFVVIDGLSSYIYKLISML